MKIETIDKDTYNLLLKIQKEYPALTLDTSKGRGYQYLNHNNLSETEKSMHKIVNDILKKHIHGYSSFENFSIRKTGAIACRFNYNYNYDNNGIPFIGVGYIEVNELLNGFEK